ncbi:MAG TPA: DNA-binding protein, partial [Marinobacter adhaerens]|nr:DNA-binding protein [Marinobacter adhaerens]
MNREYDFTLKYSVPQDFAHDQLESSLSQAGCDDAIIGLGQKGRLALNFTREAESAEQAMLSALQDGQRAVPEARLVEAGPDFVGISDMASLLM